MKIPNDVPPPRLLSPAQRASLALRITAARCLDPECASEDASEQTLLVAACGILNGEAKGAPVTVQSEIMIGPFLRSAAERLTPLLTASSSATGSANILQAKRILDDLAQCWDGHSNGNGSTSGSSDADALGGGLLELINIIEAHVRALLQTATGFRIATGPAIQYALNLADDDLMLAPFGVTGDTNIKSTPREVTLVLKTAEFTSRDLLHVVYTVHHELICHAFQAALAAGDLPNAHPSCHWTEGWMDTLAFDVTCDWVGGLAHADTWIPLKGDDARGELWRFHDHRYVTPPGLKAADVRRRRGARAAFRKLVHTLATSRLASSANEAQEIAHRFTLNANTHPAADCRRLKQLGTRLRIALLNVVRPEAPVEAALACLRFTQGHDFEQLEAEIAAVSS